MGPRYCPSIEDKIVRFADKERHQLFLEPEGRNTEEVYVQGLSTSLPEDVQRDLVHSIKGLENAEMMRTGYAIEYDMVLPHQLRATLETKKISGLFTAGQTNGGYWRRTKTTDDYKTESSHGSKAHPINTQI